MSDSGPMFGGDIPGYYDRGLGPVIFEDFAQSMARRVAAFAPRRVLEMAAGTGIVSRRLRDALPAVSHLTVTDISPPMLTVARSKFAAGEAASFQPADACALPFEGGAFDLIVCQFGVMFFPDKAKGYAEAFRVLAPGGRYLFSVWDAPAHNRFGVVAQETVTSLFAADAPRFYDIPFGYHAIDAVRAGAEGAGFEAFAAQVARIDKTVSDVEGFASGLTFGNPLIDQLRALGDVDPNRVHRQMTAALTAAFGNTARLSLQAIFFEVTRPAS